MHKAVIMGVGPDCGLGAQLCKRFAKEGLHVVAAGRTPASLDAVVADIERAGGKASSFAADATTEADVAAVFEHAGPDVDLAIYNAGNNTPLCASPRLVDKIPASAIATNIVFKPDMPGLMVFCFNPSKRHGCRLRELHQPRAGSLYIEQIGPTFGLSMNDIHHTNYD